MVMKLSAFFQSVSGVPAGWSEQYLDTQSATQATALTNWDTNIRAARCGCLSAQYSVRYLRAVDTSNVRAAQVKAYTQAQGAGQIALAVAGANDWGPAAPEAMPAIVALILRCEATAAFRRMFLLRGLPLSMVGADLVYNPNGAGNQSLQALILALVQSKYGLMSQPRGAIAFPNAIVITPTGTALQMDFPGATAPPGFVVNGKIRVKAVGGASGKCNGLWTIAQILPSTPDGAHTRIFTYGKRFTLYGNPLGGGVYPVNPTPVAFTAVIPIRGTKKATGRPFGQLRGRALARRS